MLPETGTPRPPRLHIRPTLSEPYICELPWLWVGLASAACDVWYQGSVCEPRHVTLLASPGQ